MAEAAPLDAREQRIVLLIAAVQFVNILDFVMVMPMGPDFGRALGIPLSELGWIGGSYTASAGLAGIAGSFFLDRFDRRKALAVAMVGLVLATAAGGLAWGLGSLMAARVLAGMFGGPATSLALSVVADVIPPERRGRAMGTVMSAFAFASVFGVPMGLELARLGSWRLPFFATAALGLVIVVLAMLWLPPMNGHLQSGARPRTSLLSLLERPLVRRSMSMTAVAMAAGFMVIPNISAFVQGNLHLPREQLGLMYAVGGVASFFTTRFVGPLVDRRGSSWVGAVGSTALAASMAAMFVLGGLGLPVVVYFVAFMVSMAFRNVSYNVLASKVPRAEERAAFMSLQSAVQHFASAAGAFISSMVLVALPDGSLQHIDLVGGLSITLTLLLPLLMRHVERGLALR